MRVDQVLCAAGPVDAVTNQALACRRLFDAWGWEGGDVAPTLASGAQDAGVRPLRALARRHDGVLLLHYSGYTPELERVVDGGRPSMLISHNVTPAHWFWAYEPVEALRCALAPRQLAALARAADAAAGVSEFNAQALRREGASAEVIPVLFDRDRLPPPAGEPEGPPTVLFVGRLAPHKRQDLVIRAFALYRRRHAPDARLVLVGVPLSPSFEAGLRMLADQVAPGAVTIESGIPAPELWERYRRAHAFLCLSEHEGFCIPLLEAMHFGVPAIARRAGGVPEVLGDAGLLVEREDGVAVVAELLHLAVSDGELRAELRRRAAPRLEAYAHDRVAARLRERLEALSA